MARTHRRLPIMLVTVLALFARLGSARASEFSDDLKARRARVMERLGPTAMLVVWSAPAARYSLDVDYEYRQDSNLFYLTGLEQEETILVLMPGNASRREILFIKDRNPAREQWTGQLLSADEATARTGIDTVMNASQFDDFASSILARQPFGAIKDKEPAAFFQALEQGTARVAVLPDAGRRLGDRLTRPLEFAQKVRERFFGLQVVDATPILTEFRMVKTPYERKMLVTSLEISSDAQKAGMKAAHESAFEYEVKAAIESVFRSRGAVSWSYPSIVGSGPNATILHYPDADRQMLPGELLLVDAACNYQYASGDITRTYPINGTFSPEQKAIYQIVLDAQDQSAALAKPGNTLKQMHEKTVEVIKAGLLKLGLITDASGDQFRMWYPHGSSHYIGIDVHDVGSNTRPLEPGMAFTIEPGIYIRESVLENLPRNAENDAVVERIRPAVKKYANIGIRVEDSFLLEPSGLRRLSASVPRTVDEVEAFLRKPRGSK